MAPASKLQKKENEIGCFVAQRFADWYTAKASTEKEPHGCSQLYPYVRSMWIHCGSMMDPAG